MSSEQFADSRRSLWDRYSIVTSGRTRSMPERLSQNKTRQQELLYVSAWCISNIVGFIYGQLVKNFVCLLLNLMKPETLSTCSFLFTLRSDDVVSIDDDHWEICDVIDKDRLAHDKLTHDKGCETGIIEFVVKFRVNDKPAVNARQQVVKRTPASLLRVSFPNKWGEMNKLTTRSCHDMASDIDTVMCKTPWPIHQVTTATAHVHLYKYGSVVISLTIIKYYTGYINSNIIMWCRNLSWNYSNRKSLFCKDGPDPVF